MCWKHSISTWAFTVIQQRLQSTGDPEPVARFHTVRTSLFPMAAAGQWHANLQILAALHSSTVTTYLCSFAAPQSQAASHSEWMLFMHSSALRGIWGFLFFIPSLSCYCILSIVSMRDLLSLGCHTSWSAAKKVSRRESCRSHYPRMTDSQTVQWDIQCIERSMCLLHRFDLQYTL